MFSAGYMMYLYMEYRSSDLAIKDISEIGR
jgi:hypothetical protein